MKSTHEVQTMPMTDSFLAVILAVHWMTSLFDLTFTEPFAEWKLRSKSKVLAQRKS